MYLVPMVVGSVVPLVTLPLITEVLTPEAYGAWALAVAYATFITGIANLGLTAGYERTFFQYTEPVDRAALLHGVVLLVLATTLCGLGITWIWADAIGLFVLRLPDQGRLVLVAFVASLFTSVKAYYLLHFRNSDDARRYAWYSVDETVLGAGLSVGFVVGLEWGPVGLAAGQAVAAGVVLGLVAWRLARASWSLRRQARGRVVPLVREALAISLPLTPRAFLGVVGAQFDKYIIGLLGSPTAVGVYALGQRIAYMAFQVMTAIENIFVPEVYRRMFAEGEAARHSLGRYLTPFGYLSAAVAVAVMLGAEEAVLWLAPPSYQESVTVVCLLGASYGLMFFGKMPQLTYAKRTALASVLTVVSIAANVAFNLWTVPRWGVLGAAAGTLAAGVLTGALGFVIRQRLYPIVWQRLAMTLIFGTMFLTALVVAVLPSVVPDYAVRVAMRVALGAGFLGLGWGLGIVTMRQIADLRHRVFSRSARS